VLIFFNTDLVAKEKICDLVETILNQLVANEIDTLFSVAYFYRNKATSQTLN